MKSGQTIGRGINGNGMKTRGLIPLPFIPLPMLLVLLFLSGCTLRWHTGPAPIVVDHGDHVEVVP
jgi:hypothetical protein